MVFWVSQDGLWDWEGGWALGTALSTPYNPHKR